MKRDLKGKWFELLQMAEQEPYFQQLQQFLATQYTDEVVYPPRELVFKALELTPFETVKVVILGQDPYHGANQAEGLSFSVKSGLPVPPSLRNIYKELADDLAIPVPTDGSLSNWATQGVLLLNTVLTVRAHQPNSHKQQGWEQFTDSLIAALNEREQPVVFILWGKPAQQKRQQIDTERHFIIEGPHPSPLSSYRGFFGSKPFSQTNAILENIGVEPIDWSCLKQEPINQQGTLL
ncbi:uracil-DNA glycosylase [Brochothrix campestris]|uniref:Uracil-DNA glycosylase n=1 Tax=Brochothrix campestris FSL F6-1037 TaxID=1265861 RepID=W7CQZ4_9LIST|nr:uracil-DNA glycosylase [Brochothrix campestris]EUJ42069.1 uracil-DNA glycosylase [Brochothrix campestris FSL F6-1037]